MFNVGLGELLVFIIITVIILGPTRLPEGIRMFLNSYRKLKLMMMNVQNDIDKELKLFELQSQLQEEMQKIKELEDKLHDRFQSIEEFIKHQKNDSENIDFIYTPLEINIYAPTNYHLFFYKINLQKVKKVA
ncbi:Sec-independent protein translocase protein TatB [Acinetobacter puyangensis]|uniref:Sec-independent protein translocase protein TatB n=1 Tax=Acinetobacter puyangensis TaxID=1096779 RepID=A0A240E8L4_9GAMM|nr:Sec-independent protein translocase protein TatB [Acinetobacter puyangensis]SNX44861.1 sec-independent protein translocase protein TatB [Acinetobacter puyangensis]